MTQIPLFEVKMDELPIYCPNPQMPHWSSHPRVFIDLSHGEASCPYCSTRYVLRDSEAITHHPTSV